MALPLPLLVFSFLFLFFLSKHANALNSEVYHFCQNGTFDPQQQNTLSTTTLLSDLVAHSSTNTFYSSSSSASGPNKTTYGLFYCTANVNSRDCNTCVRTAASDAQLHCHSYKAAVLFYTDCTLRYNSTAVHATPDDSVVAWRFSSGMFSSVSYTGFNKTLYDTMNTLITEASYGAGSKGYATGEASLVGTSERLYALAQCTPDIIGGPCKTCLDLALELMPGCCIYDIWGPEKTVLMTFLPSCQLRYEVKYPSSSGGTPSASHGTPSYASGKIFWYIIVGVAVAAFGLQ